MGVQLVTIIPVSDPSPGTVVSSRVLFADVVVVGFTVVVVPTSFELLTTSHRTTIFMTECVVWFVRQPVGVGRRRLVHPNERTWIKDQSWTSIPSYIRVHGPIFTGIWGQENARQGEDFLWLVLGRGNNSNIFIPSCCLSVRPIQKPSSYGCRTLARKSCSSLLSTTTSSANLLE